MPISVATCEDHRHNERFLAELLVKEIDTSLLLSMRWESPSGVPAGVLSRIAATYRGAGWTVTWKNGSKRIVIWNGRNACRASNTS